MTSKNLRIQTQKNRTDQRDNFSRITLCNENVKPVGIRWILPAGKLSCDNEKNQNTKKPQKPNNQKNSPKNR